MAEWITDRTQEDVDRVNELHDKAALGTWTTGEQAEWVSGMKGALNAKDFNRITSGMQELANIVGAQLITKTSWSASDYIKFTDIYALITDVESIREKCSGFANTPDNPYMNSIFKFSGANQIEQILSDIESLAKTYVTFAGEYSCGEGQYGF